MERPAARSVETVTADRPEPRLEDGPLLTGAGRFTGDVRFEREAALVVLRSPVACGRIVHLGTTEAARSPGVLDVLTAADLPPEAAGFTPTMVHPAPDGGPMWMPPYPPLSRSAVRFVGDPVAAVVAETPELAADAAERIALRIDTAAAVTDPLEALRPGAPAVWPACPANHAFRVETGERGAVDRALGGAAHVVRQRLEISRVTAAPIEPRNALALFDPAADASTLFVGTQSPHRLAAALAAAMGIAPERLRVVSGDTGGSFGMKNAAYPEYALALLAARRTGRPVRWEPGRTESFLADSHGREQVVDAALALDETGGFLALDVAVTANIGAYLGPMSTHPMVANVGGLAGVYRTPAIAVRVDGVFTHTQNMAPYRGAGRPEAAYVIERLADIAARRLGLDPVAIRRRNMIAPEEMPFRTGLAYSYDCGDFPAVMDEALRAADRDGFAARRAASARRGLLRGLGVANPIEIAAGPEVRPNREFAHLALAPDGGLTAAIGSSDSGQGHRTTFAALLARRLGVPREAIGFLTGDTGAVERGTGTFGSRTAAAAGTALVTAADRLVEAARADAAELLEAAAADVAFGDGAFRIVGTDRTITLPEVVRRTGRGVAAQAFVAAEGGTFPNGCHVCEVEVDPATGATRLVAYTVVDDVGTVLEPALVDGQIHGGVAQGIGQALMERLLYEPGSGQLVTASFMDYAMPRAADLPPIGTACRPVPTAHNPLGVKGVGEAGVVGALPATINAVVDALAPLGVLHIDMPATPERVWRAIRDAPR